MEETKKKRARTDFLQLGITVQVRERKRKKDATARRCLDEPEG